MIIDFRLRPPVGGYLQARMYDVQRTVAFNRKLTFNCAPSVRELDFGLTLQEMDDAGIGLGVIVGRAGSSLGSVTNDELEGFVTSHAQRFVGIAGLDVTDVDGAVGVVAGIRERKAFAGVTLEPGWADEAHHYDDPRLYPIYDAAQSLGVPVVMLGGGNAGPDISFSSPVRIDRVAADFPDMRIVVAHGGFPWITEVLGMAFRRPNVFLSPDMYLFTPGAATAYVEAANTYLAEQFIFASSYPFCPLIGSVEKFYRLPFRRDVLPLLMRGNAERVLGDAVTHL